MFVHMLACTTADQQHSADAELQRLAGANAAALAAAQLDAERAQAALQSQIRSSIIAAAAVTTTSVTAATAAGGAGSGSNAGTAEQLAEAQSQVQQLLAEAEMTQALLCKYSPYCCNKKQTCCVMTHSHMQQSVV
jgi:hypothetical protein